MWTRTLIEVRVRKLAADLLDDLDMLKIGTPTQTKDSVDSEIREVVLVLAQHFAAQRRARDVEQVLAKALLIRTVSTCQRYIIENRYGYVG